MTATAEMGVMELPRLRCRGGMTAREYKRDTPPRAGRTAARRGMRAADGATAPSTAELMRGALGAVVELLPPARESAGRRAADADDVTDWCAIIAAVGAGWCACGRLASSAAMTSTH